LIKKASFFSTPPSSVEPSLQLIPLRNTIYRRRRKETRRKKKRAIDREKEGGRKRGETKERGGIHESSEKDGG